MPEIESDLRQQILWTAKTLFVNKGYHGMSMREIAEALGVSKAALYYHFKDKEELFLAILHIYLEEMSAMLDRLAAEPVSGIEKIRMFVEGVLAQPAEQRATIRLGSQEINQLSAGARQAFGVLYREKFIGKLQRILQDGMDAGELRRMPAETAVWALLGIMFPYFYPAHAQGGSIAPETARAVAEIILDGLAAR